MAKSIQPEKNYRVKFAQAVEVSPGIWARPGDGVTLSGAMLQLIIEAVKEKVESYEEA